MDYLQKVKNDKFLKLANKLKEKVADKFSKNEINEILAQINIDTDYIPDVRVTHKVDTFAFKITLTEELTKTSESDEYKIEWQEQGRLLFGNDLVFGINKKVYEDGIDDPIEQVNKKPNFTIENKYAVFLSTDKGDNYFSEVIYIYIPVQE